MLLEKVYAETIDVRDPQDYCARPETYIMTYLRRRFVNRSRGGAFIVKILEILTRSDCTMKETDLTAEGYVNVQFRALVSVLGQWDIVTGVRIANRSQMIVGRSEVEGETVATVVLTPQAETVRVGQIVAIRVLRAQYSPDQPQATAVGPLLTCDKAAPVYAVTGLFSAEDARGLLPLVARVKDLLAARAALMEKRRNDVLFFETLLYSYACSSFEKKAQTVETASGSIWEGPEGCALPAGVVVVNLLTFVEDACQSGKGPANAEGTWSRDLAFYRSSPLAAMVLQGTAPPSQWSAATAASPRTAFASMLTTVHTFLKAINEMVELYDTEALLASHKNIWLAMRGAQLPAP